MKSLIYVSIIRRTMNAAESGNLSLLRTWGRAIRAIWNKEARRALRNGEFIASHLQMTPFYTAALDSVVSLLLGAF
jgi:hypothetical protein